MKAAVLIEPYNMVIEEAPVPVAERGEVVLKVHSCGICGTDLEMYRIGSYHPRAILGHECSGVIEEIGPGVEGWNIGDRVAVDDVFTCGECNFCRSGRPKLCQNATTLGGQWPGAFAEYTKTPAGALIRLPDNVSMEEGSLLQVLAVGYHVASRASLTPAAKTLIVGAGPVGLSVLAALKDMEYHDVIVSAKHPIGKKAAEALGASAVLDAASNNLVAEVESIFSSAPQLVIECVGSPATVMQSLEMVEKEGTVVVVGNCFQEITLQPITWILKEINIKGSDATTPESFEAAVRCLAERKIDPSIFLTRTVSLNDLPKTMEMLAEGKDDIKVTVNL